MKITPANVSSPRRNSGASPGVRYAVCGAAAVCQRALIIRAARIVSGKLVKSGVRNTNVNITATQATRLTNWERPPALSFTAEGAILPPAICPPNRPVARLTTAKLFNSVGIDLIAMFVGVILRDAQRLAERDKQNSDRRRDHERQHPQRDRRYAKGWQTFGQYADDCHAVGCVQVEGLR